MWRAIERICEKIAGFLGRNRWRIPVVQQMTATECGPACLAMVFGYFGKRFTIEQIRQHIVGGREGTTAVQIIEAGQQLGLRGRGVRVSVDNVHTAGTGAILHWDFSHFVVFDHKIGDCFYVVDPGLGRRCVSASDFARAFTGIAILFEPTAEFYHLRDQQKHWSWRYIRHVTKQRHRLVQICILSIFVQVLALAVPLVTAHLVDEVIPALDLDRIYLLVVAIAFATLYYFCATAVRGVLLAELSTVLDFDTSLAFLEHMIDLPFGFFQQRTTGDLVARLRSNTVLRETLTSSALSAVLDGLMILIYSFVVFLFSWKLGCAVAGVALLEFSVLWATRRKRQELTAENLAKESKSQSYQIEMISGIQTIKSMGHEPFALRHWTGLFVEVLNASVARGRLEALIDAASAAIRFVTPLLLLVIGADLVIHKALTLGQMLAATTLAIGFLAPLSGLLTTAGQLLRLRSYLERLEDVYHAEREQPSATGLHQVEITGDVMIDSVDFRYTPGAPLVLRGISIRIKPGEFVAIVGASGAGKSTLAALLVGLFEPSAGKILFNNIDMRRLYLRTVRKQIGYVPQDPAFFGDSIKNNITMEDSYSMDDVIRASDMAQFHEDIIGMKMGFETFLIDRGASLSGGQRQRLALARSLIRKPKLLILDEATSALDSLTERSVQQALAKMTCTRIVIAHRLSTIKNADRIVVLQEGSIVEQGTHRELLSHAGLYATLVTAQELDTQVM
jgi:ABC-type bacteriocin/lantibiotic exporter with double-glycine peptidase domain